MSSKTDKSVKSNKSEVEKKDSSTKTASITIFVILGIFLIVYVVYAFEAYKNGWYPFKDYVQVIPANGVQPLGKVSAVSQEELDDIAALKEEAFKNYCAFYDNQEKTGRYPLPPFQFLVDCKKFSPA